jgi:hypothetical protein
MVTNEWVYVYNDLVDEGSFQQYKTSLKQMFGIEEPMRYRLQTIGFINLVKLSRLHPELSFMVSYEIPQFNVYEYVYLQNGKIISHIERDILEPVNDFKSL